MRGNDFLLVSKTLLIGLKHRGFPLGRIFPRCAVWEQPIICGSPSLNLLSLPGPRIKVTKKGYKLEVPDSGP